MNGLSRIFMLVLGLTLLIQCTGESGGQGGRKAGTTASVLPPAQQTFLESKVKEVKAALDAYYVEYGEYPEMLDMLIPDYAPDTNLIIDPWGTQFKLETDEGMNLFLVSAGDDRVFGNKDDIKRRI